uniref:Uncharacterized protein n=1 Tax=Timema cristinae TaxID=61476 RepID=A0A7R9D511_TIMCR|nr:unnamed protein product [Timema cristinae]
MSIPASHRGKMTVNIEMDNSEIVRVLAHLGLVSVIFFYTTCSLGEIIRRSLKMTKGGPYFDPYSKDFKSLSVLLYGICHCKYCREPIPKDIWNQASSADPHLSWYLQAWIIEKKSHTPPPLLPRVRSLSPKLVRHPSLHYTLPKPDEIEINASLEEQGWGLFGTDEIHKRIVLLPKQLDEELKNTLRIIYTKSFIDLTQKEANYLLLLASPKEVLAVSKADEPQEQPTILISNARAWRTIEE